MALETFEFIDDLNASNPVGATDPKSQGDDHLRGIKATLKNTFPNFTGALSLTHTQVNNAAIKNEANVFTLANSGGDYPLRLESSTPGLLLRESDAGTDEKNWDIVAAAGSLRHRIRNDVFGNAVNYLTVARSGSTVSVIDLLVGSSENAIKATANGAVDLYHDNAIKIKTSSIGAALRGSAAVSATPVSSDSPDTRTALQDSAGVDLGLVGFAGSSQLRMLSRMHGGLVALEGENTSGTLQNLVVGDPDGAVSLYSAGSLRIQTQVNGSMILRSDGNTDSESRRIEFMHANATLRGIVGYSAGSELQVRNLIHGGLVALRSEDTGGTLRALMTGDPDGRATLYHAGVTTFRTDGSGVVSIAGDQSNDTDARLLQFINASASRRALIGHLSTGGELTIRNEVHGNAVNIEAEDAGGTVRTLLTGDPDAITVIRGDTGVEIQTNESGELGLKTETNGVVRLYYNAIQRMITQASGIVSIRSDGNTDTENRELRFEHQNGTDRGIVGHNSGGDLVLRQLIHGNNLALQAEDGAGSNRNLLVGNGDGDLSLYNNTATNEVSLITRPRSGDNTTAAQVRHRDNTLYDIGLNIIPIDATLASGNDTLAADNVGMHLQYNTGTGRTLNANNDSNIPTGSAWQVRVGPTGGTLTLQGGTGVVIRYWDGTAYQDTAAAGSVTLGEGLHIIHKDASTRYYVDGPGIS